MKKTTGNLERRLAAYGAKQKEKAQKVDNYGTVRDS